MICKSNNNSYHGGTSAFFFDVFSEKDSHLNAVEKTDAPKNFINVTGKHTCFAVKFAKFLWTPLFTEHLWWLLLSMLLFMNVFSFTSLLLPHFHYFLKVMLLSSFEETLSSLYHYYYIITIIIPEWFIRIAATTTTYCTATSMIVICISALMEFILKWKKNKIYE